jgi:CheY-like chemotaxis protein/two-component sensor histidine kinase
MSHELRTPLTGILGLSEVLQMGTYGTLTEKQLKYIKSIESSGRHLLELINDILDLSKIEAGKLDMIMDRCSVAELCKSSLQMVKGMSHQKKINIEFSIEPAVMTVHADVRRMKQMLVNLLSNALKFTPEEGRVGLQVKGHVDEDSIYICVWDQGIGIKPEDLKKLFKPFTQLDSALSRQYSGTGLGLSLVQRMAELQGGSITVESAPGEGSRFTIIMPWSEDDTQVQMPEPVEEGSVPLTHQLVIAEKDLDSERIMHTLREIGIARFSLTAAQGALEKVVVLRPSAILLDLDPSDCFVSLELLGRLKQDEDTSDIPVVVASIENHRSQAMELGAAGFLVKPYGNQELQAGLAKVTNLPALTAPLLVIRSRVTAPVILLADDDENILDMLTEFLQSKGYRAIAAHSGFELLELAPKFHPDLMLVDIQMPGMDGMETMRRVRAHPDPVIASTPMIAVTALAMTGDREACLRAGANEYMSKPLVMKKLLGQIEKALEK